MSSSIRPAEETLKEIELQDKDESEHSEEANQETRSYKCKMGKYWSYVFMVAAFVLGIEILVLAVRFYITGPLQDEEHFDHTCSISSILSMVGGALLVITPFIALFLRNKTTACWWTCIVLIQVAYLPLVVGGCIGVKCYQQMDKDMNTGWNKEATQEAPVFKSGFVPCCEDLEDARNATIGIHCNYCASRRNAEFIAVIFGMVTLAALLMAILRLYYLQM